VSENGVVGLLLKEKARLLKQIELFTDIRKNPQIKLTHIVLSVLLMPFFSLHSLLSGARLPQAHDPSARGMLDRDHRPSGCPT
jgi:hypothetical protein